MKFLLYGPSRHEAKISARRLAFYRKAQAKEVTKLLYCMASDRQSARNREKFYIAYMTWEKSVMPVAVGFRTANSRIRARTIAAIS